MAHVPGLGTVTECVCLRVSVCVCSGSAALDESWVQADVSDVMSVQQPGEETLQAQTVTAVRTRAVLPLKHTKTNPVDTQNQLTSGFIFLGRRCSSVFLYLVSVPVVRGRVDSLPLVSLQQLLRVPDTHRASDNLANVWHQHVDLPDRQSTHQLVNCRASCTAFKTMLTGLNRPNINSDNESGWGSYRLSEASVLGAALHVEGFDLSWETTEQDGLVDLVRHQPLRSLGDVLKEMEGTHESEPAVPDETEAEQKLV